MPVGVFATACKDFFRVEFVIYVDRPAKLPDKMFSYEIGFFDAGAGLIGCLDVRFCYVLAGTCEAAVNS
jgi:hypothetical protein